MLFRLSWLSLIWILAVPLFMVEAAENSAEHLEDVIIQTQKDAFRFDVEIADTPAKSSRGLMFRESMPARQGMLFLMNGRQIGAMWMKDTILSLDMIFIDRDGIVINIARNTTPYSLDTVTASGPTAAVLELNAGVADEIGLKAGDQIFHPKINPATR